MTPAKPLTTTPEIHTMSPHLTDLFAAFCRAFLDELPHHESAQLPLQLVATPVEPPPSDLMPIREAAKRANRGYSTVRGWIADGKLIAHHGQGSHELNAPVLVSLSAVLAHSTPPRRLPSVLTERPFIIRRDGLTGYLYVSNEYIAIAKRHYPAAECREEEGKESVYLSEAEARGVGTISAYLRNLNGGRSNGYR